MVLDPQAILLLHMDQVQAQSTEIFGIPQGTRLNLMNNRSITTLHYVKLGMQLV